MNDEGSEKEAPFIERDDRETTMAYDTGRIPLYIVVAWVCFIVAYVVVMAIVALPDLRAWMAH
jgi:hypothetical protein